VERPGAGRASTWRRTAELQPLDTNPLQAACGATAAREGRPPAARATTTLAPEEAETGTIEVRL
jgi:hypothetical protein